MSEIKLCKDCKWYTGKSSGPEFARCASPRVVSKVDGRAVEFCSIRRNDTYKQLPIYCIDEWEPINGPRPGQIIPIPTIEKAKPWWRFW